MKFAVSTAKNKLFRPKPNDAGRGRKIRERIKKAIKKFAVSSTAIKKIKLFL